VSFEMDFALTARHPDYAAPPRSESECFRGGALRLLGVRKLSWEEQGQTPAVDASGEEDWGHIDSFEWEDGRFVLVGDFGSLEADAEKAEAALVEG
jgi:hypothetical protein